MDGSRHSVRRPKEGPGQAQKGVEMLVRKAWGTHHQCPLALEQSVMGSAGINVKQKKYAYILYMDTIQLTEHPSFPRELIPYSPSRLSSLAISSTFTLVA